MPSSLDLSVAKGVQHISETLRANLIPASPVDAAQSHMRFEALAVYQKLCVVTLNLEIRVVSYSSRPFADVGEPLG